jgi:hypothetical protein
MGIREDLLEVKDFYVSMILRHRFTNFRWEMVTVYGLAQHERAQDFIVELSRKCLVASLPLVFGGDFNLIRSREEKSSG